LGGGKREKGIVATRPFTRPILPGGKERELRCSNQPPSSIGKKKKKGKGGGMLQLAPLSRQLAHPSGRILPLLKKDKEGGKKEKRESPACWYGQEKKRGPERGAFQCHLYYPLLNARRKGRTKEKGKKRGVRAICSSRRACKSPRRPKKWKRLDPHLH